MNLTDDDARNELRSTVRAFLERKSPESEVRRLMSTEDGYDREVWLQMAQQLGLQGLAIPEEYGGAGFGFSELLVVLEEMGRRLLVAPFFSTAVLAAGCLLYCDDDGAKSEYLPQIASGECIATVAFAEADGTWDCASIATTARETDQGWALSGVKSFVTDGHTADLIFIAARTPSGVSVFAVAGDAPGMTRIQLTTVDETRKLARLELDGVPGRLIGSDGAGSQILDRVLDLAAAALAGEQVGGAQFVLDMAVQYAKDRVQFGKQIGSFQAIKHKCADLLLEVESAKAVSQYVAHCPDNGDESFAVAAAMAKAVCSDMYFHVAAENVHIHGGIGFTWEHAAHLYFKRAKSSEVLFGSATVWRRRLGDRVGI
jgi:alkylation response protein AidB-like acyl-CoA dehydrogenase